MNHSDKRSYFDQLAVRWDDISTPPGKADKVADFCRRACRNDPRSLLDVGSGTGMLAPHLLELGAGTELFVECDFALAMLRESYNRRPEATIGHVCADVMALPFRASAFDTVLCYGILPHLSDLPSALDGLLRALKTGGTISVGHHLGSRELNAMHQKIGGPVGHDHLIDADSLATMFRELGARDIEASDEPEGYFVRAAKGC